MSDFKLKLATGLTGTIPVSHSQVHLGDTATDFGAKVLDNTVSAILQLREHLNFDHVERAIDILNGARRIEFYGLGNSNIVAQDAHYKFFPFRHPEAIAYGDLYMQAASAALLGKGDVIVAVSKSGRAPELLRVLEIIAMQQGCDGGCDYLGTSRQLSAGDAIGAWRADITLSFANHEYVDDFAHFASRYDRYPCGWRGHSPCGAGRGC